MTGDPLIELRDVNKHFGPLHVLRDIAFTVGRGEVVAVIGPSGAGKSGTLCRIMNGPVAVDAGRGLTEGEPLPAGGWALARLRADVGMVFPADDRVIEDGSPDDCFTAPLTDRARDFLSTTLQH